MHFSTGGMPRYILEQIKNLIDVYEIFVVEYSYYGDDFVTHRNLIIDLVGKNFYSLSSDKSIILDLIGKIDPDIIHMGELPEMFMDNEIAKKIYSNDRKYKIIATTHDSSWNIDNIIFLPDHFVFVSKYSQEQFEPLGIQSSVVLYPIEYKVRPDRTETLLKLGLDPNLKHVLNVGIFTERKNQGELIEYARKVQDYPIQFHFIGSLAGNFQYYWESLIDNRPGNCIMWGERGDVDVFYSCMDLFVFTSCARPGDTETNPLVIREATSWHMPFLMYNLDVYRNTYDEYVNIKYLTQDKDENLKMILNELKINKPIYIFSHNYLVNNWEEIFIDQLSKLFNSNLYSNADKIFFGVYSPTEENYLKFKSAIVENDVERKISVVKFEENLDEFTTLSFLQKTINDLNFDVNVLYYHLKGVTSIQNHSDVNVTHEAVTSWRNVMEYFLIEKWQNCIELLNGIYDSVGCFWNDENHEMYPNMYCGNFWWSKTSHIKKLPNINDIKNDRMNAERWIGMESHKWFNMKSPTLENNQLYEAVWKPEEYRNDKNPIFIFSHNYLVNNWKKVVTNQLTKLVDSGLYDYAKIYYYAYCEDNNTWIDFVNLIKKYDVNDKIILSLLYRNNYEFDVLNRIYDFCINYNGNGRILYYHTKGVVSEHDENNNKKAIISWRNKLEETTITNWKHCVDNLDTHDIVGPFYFDQNPDLTPIFAGNFWWTNISYIKKLKKVDDTGGRGNCENWITSIPHKPLNLYSPKDLNLYQVSIEKNIAVFSHNYLVNDWKYIVEEQLYLLESGDLYEAATDIYMTYYAPNEQEEIDFLNIVSKYPKIKTFKLRDNNFEFPTLHIIKKYCDNKPETKICYYHTKGSSNKARNMETWRKYINHFIITKWKTNVEALNNNDVSFVDDEYNSYHNLTDRQKTCGNFWWANSSYIKTLKEVDIYDEDRFNAELWILSNAAVRKCSIFESGYVNEHPFEYLYAKFYSPYFYRIDHEKFVDEIYWSSNKYFSIQQKEKEWKDLLLYILNNDIKTDNALEIGRYNGGTTHSLCQLFDNVVSIDIERQPNIDFLEEVNQNLTIITADSKDIKTVELIKSFDKKFDLIFIDGDHSYEGVKKDLELYNKFLSPTGVILFHDIIHSEWHTNMNCGVPELWDELKNKYNTHEIISTDKNEITDINSYNDILKSQCEKYEQFGGIGILTKAGRLNHLLKRRRMLLDYLDTPMTNDFDTLLGLKEIADEFLNKNSVMAEIGSYAGVSSELFALHCKEIYCIDPWEYNGKEDFNSFRAENEFDNTLSKNDNMFKIKDTSDVAVNMFEDSSLDLVYIDGCHDYECVLDDINNWLPKVKNGGVISGHDYHLPQVKNAVDKFFNNIKTYQDNSWLVKIDRNNNLDKKRIPWFDEVGGINTLHGLDELCKDFIKPDFIIAEIGSYAGVSSELFSNYCKHITCIDPWVEYGEMNSDEISNGEKLFDSMIKDKTNITKLKRYSSDAVNYFKDDYFDLIYIDASHEYDDVKNDITYWLPKIKTNGIISGHDYNNENVKRAIHDTIGLDDIKVYSDSSWAKKINIVNVEKPIYIFSHNYLVYNWEEILKEQLTGIILNELYQKTEKIYYCVYSESELDYNKFLFLISLYDYLHKIEIVRHRKNDREYHTLMLIKKFSNDIGKDVDILYYHMKGVYSQELIKHNKETITKWRKYLEYFNIEKWKDCVEQLKTYDTVGCLYINMWFEKYGESRMYAGNFWWSHSDYIKNLPDLNLSDIEEWPIHLETWITKNPYPHSWYNYYTAVQDNTWDFYSYFPDESVWKGKKEDSICIVTSHPNYRAIEETTIKCIESLKATGRKVILGTHCKISDKLNNITDYHVLDEEHNPMIKHDFFDTTWFSTEDYKVTINLHKFDNDKNHALGVYINLFNGILKAKELGYKYAICTNFDLIFSDLDYNVFNDKIKELNDTGKKAFFMYSKSVEGDTLKTIFFITDVNYFLEKFKILQNEEDYNEDIKLCGSETNCLENYFWNKLSE